MNLQKIWNDVRGNVYYGAAVFILVSAWTGITIVTHGLKWWQQAILSFLCALLCVWAAIATYLARARVRVPYDPPAQTQKAVEETMSLPDRLNALAKDLFSYLKTCGEESPPSISYIMRVHNGFLRDLYPKVEDVAYDLGIAGYVDFTFATLLGSHHDAFSYHKIREIAEYLLKIKNEMELKGLQSGTLTQKDIDNMPSDEYRKRLANPTFKNQVNMLGLFKRQ